MLTLLFAVFAARFSFPESSTAPQRVSVAIQNREFNAEIADTIATRNHGLSDRASLPQDAAMLFVFQIPGPYGFWMKDMHFPIDIIWIRRGKIIGFSENLPPPAPGTSMLKLPSYYPPGTVDRVLEINAGLVKKYGIAVGDPVAVVF